MTPPSKLETGIVTFGKVRRWLVAGFGVFVAGKGIYLHQWLLIVLGVAIIAYGMLAPT
jgi:hypothetical protein